MPNFVVQAGCPRGDGYGGLNYTIRSELNLNYYLETGLLGMAHTWQSYRKFSVFYYA